MVAESAGSPHVTSIDGSGVVPAPFLTVAEVADRMRVSKMTVYRLVHGGELPAVRFGRSFRVQQTAVDELIRDARYEAG
jgi:excisionase family DNA binding protein